MADAELPKQEQLIKLLKMTTSANDAEALAFMRKANALLASAGWDWERLIQGKIKVIADPFGQIPVPQAAKPPSFQQPRNPPPPPPPPRRPPPPQRRGRKTEPSIFDL